MSTTKRTPPVAEICLYGNRETGAGYIVRRADGRMYGNGKTDSRRSFTEAVWAAVEDLRQHATPDGELRIYAPGGLLMARAQLGGHVPAYGNLQWENSPANSFVTVTITR